MANIIALVAMLLGWILIIFAAFGSGLNLSIGNLDTFDTAVVLVLFALCVGWATPVVVGWGATRRT